MVGKNSVITLYRRIMLTKITSGAIVTLPKITHIAFGDGGIDGDGNIIAPMETQEALNHEFCRYAVEEVTYPIETTARYKVTIPKSEQAGKVFSEIGLIDGEGKLCAIKTMFAKQKDEDVAFTMELDDEF